MPSPPPRKIGFWLCLAVFFSYLFLLMMVDNRADPDLWGKMALGALIHQNGAFPYHDVFSYTAPGAMWTDHEWGSGVVFYWIFLLFGSAGLFWLKIALLAGILLGAVAVYRAPDRADPGWSWTRPRYFVFLFAVFASYIPLLIGLHTTIRCQTFSFLFYVGFLWALEQLRLGIRPRSVWFLPAIMVLWVNLHGGFLYGFVVLGLYLVWMSVDRRWVDVKRLGWVIGLCLVATLVNPYGLRFDVAILSAWGMDRSLVTEWQSLFQQYGARVITFYMGYLVFWMVVCFLDWRKNPRQFPGVQILILATAWEGYRHIKLLPFFVLTAATLGPRLDLSFLSWIDIPERFKQVRVWVNRGLLLMVPAGLLAVVLAVCVSQKLKFHDGFKVLASSPTIGHRFPVDAARFMMVNKIKGNLWCDFGNGEFLFWTLYPNVKISIDGRYEAVYPKSLINDYVAYRYNAADMNAVLKYPTNYVLVPADRKDLAKKLTETKRWTLIYEDDASKLFARDFPKIPVEKTRSSGVIFIDYFKGDLRRFRTPSLAAGK